MDLRVEVREFIMSRRARIRPADAGVPGHDTRRRVAGLRREEVATRAGVSIDYYVRLERGNLTGVSESVLEAVSAALMMTADERAHLFDLARLANSAVRPRHTTTSPKVRDTVQALLDSLTGPAWVRNGRLDLLAVNTLGAALYAPLFDQIDNPPNKARFVFLDARARDFYPDWEEVARNNAAVLHTAAGLNPYDKALSDLIGELSTRSNDFRSMWADHDVLRHQAGRARIVHPVVGELQLSYEALHLAADPNQTLIAYSAANPSSTERLQFLASWIAEPDGETVSVPHPSKNG